MTKTTFALAAALFAGTSMTSAANADAVRVGFGFPLGSFVAHTNENYSGREYRQVERPHATRRDYQDDAAARKFVKPQRPTRDEDAEVAPKSPAPPIVQTAKLESKLESDPARTTVIEKTPVPANPAVNGDKNTTAVQSVAQKAEADTAPAPPETKHVCRRYSPAIAALVDVPCD
jgi:hypothetical protein